MHHIRWLAILFLFFAPLVGAAGADIALGPVGPASASGPGAPQGERAPAASPHALRLTKVGLAMFSPDGKYLLTVGEEDKQVHLWDVSNGEEANRFGDAVTHAIFSGNSARVMTWGEDGVTRIFDTRTGKALRRLEGAGERLGAGAISSDGSRALTCAVDENVIKVWDAGSGTMLGTLEGHESPVNGIAISQDGKQAVSVSGNMEAAGGAGTSGPMLRVKGEKLTPRSSGAAGENALRVWDMEGRKLIKKIDLTGAGRAVYLSANEKLALVVMNNGTKIYDLATGEDIAAARTAEERFPAGMLSGDRKTAVSKAIGAAAIVNAISGEKIRPLEGPIDGMPLCNAFSEDGSRVVLGTGKVGFFSREPNEPGHVYIYEVASGKRLASLAGHGHEVTQVGFSADGTHAFSCDGEKTLFLWTIK